jgi:DNA-binding response OmpR family regulator
MAKILIIEDDRFIGEMYVHSLRRVGHDVTWIVEGDKGLEAAKTGNFDLIILDIMLPERRGTEILNALRSERDLVPESKILVMTNFEQSEQSRSAMEAQAEGYLIKADVTPRKLMEIIDQLLAS